MTHVTVTIHGKQYRMACEDGQEAHLQQLARDLDERIVALRGQFGEIGDARLTVMAALMVADELSETVNRLKRIESERTALQDARAANDMRTQAAQNAMVTAFNAAAERIEVLAKKLTQNAAAPSDGVAQG